MGNAAISVSRDRLRECTDPLTLLAPNGAAIALAGRKTDSREMSDPGYCPLRMLAWSTSLSAALWCGLILGGIGLRNIWR
jgi:hypothetical protein